MLYRSHGNPPASKAFIEALPRLSDPPKDTACNICLETCIHETIIYKLHCSHIFHDECLLQWFHLHNTCPVCRKEYPTDDPEYEKKRLEKESLEWKARHEIIDDEEDWDPFYG